MKRYLLTLALITNLVFTYAQEARRAEQAKLLTSATWTAENNKETLKFDLNGTYTQSFPESAILVEGKWEWINDTEISLQNTDITISASKNKFVQKPDDKTVFRVVSLSNKLFEGISRHMLDAENSGFAKKFAYTKQ